MSASRTWSPTAPAQERFMSPLATRLCKPLARAQSTPGLCTLPSPPQAPGDQIKLAMSFQAWGGDVWSFCNNFK